MKKPVLPLFAPYMVPSITDAMLMLTKLSREVSRERQNLFETNQNAQDAT